MVRPRGFDDDEAEQALLDAFWRRGYARTSVPDLTAATGLLAGSLYSAFGSKEDMFRRALRRYVADLAAELASPKTGIEGLVEILHAIVRLTVRDRERRGCLLLNVIPEAAGLSADTRRELDQGLGAMKALLGLRLREARDVSGAKVDLEPLTALVFAAAVAIRVLGRAGQDRKLLQNVADGAVQAVRARLEADRPGRKGARK